MPRAKYATQSVDEEKKDIIVDTYPKQRLFITSKNPIRAFTGGIGSGKSQAGAIDMLFRSRPNCLYMVCAPTYGMLGDATMRSFIEVAQSMNLWEPRQYWTQPRPRAILKNGAEVLFRSMDDPDSLRGPSCSGIWMDEVQKTSEEAYTILLGRLRQHGRRGWLTATFTPGSPDHWTSKTFINSTNPDVFFIRASLRDNSFLDREFYEGLQRAYAASPMRIRRELEGECVYMEGAEWDASYFENCWFDEWPDPRGSLKVMSLDSSKGKGGKTGDYSAFVKMMFSGGIMYVEVDMRNDRDSTMIAQTGVDLFCEWMPHYFVVEEEMGQDLLIADMHRIADERGIIMPITPMGTDKINKEVRIRRLTPYVSRRQFRFKTHSPGTKLCLDQLMAFPLGDHDDGPDAMEYGVRMLIKATTGRVYSPRGYNLNAMGAMAL